MQSFSSWRRFSIIGLFIFSVFLFLPGLLVAEEVAAPAAQEPSPPFDLAQVPAPVTPPNARAGRALFTQNCAPCHGETGLGDGPAAADLPSPPTAFADPNAVWERSPAELFHTTKFGRLEKLMPPWSNRMTDGQIWNAVSYAWNLHTNQSSALAGGLLYAASCANCHGETGAGDGPEADGLLTDFTDARYTMAASQAGWLVGWQAAHPEVGAEFDSGQQRNVLEFVRTFSYAPVWESSYRPGNGMLSGTVVQGTTEGTPVAGLEVILEGFVDFVPVVTFTDTVATDGSFSFSNLGTDPSIVYFASASLEEISYSSPILMFGEGETSLETTVNVYGSTNDDSGISIQRAHWIVDPQPGALIVAQIYVYNNSLDRAFTGKTIEGLDVPATVSLSLPPGAVEVSFENGVLGGRFRQVGHTVYDTAPIVPGTGTRQIVVNYALPFNGTSAQFAGTLPYPALSLNMLMPDIQGVQVEVTGLASVGTQDIQGDAYRTWQSENVTPDQTVSVRLSGLLAAGELDPRAAQGGAASPRVPQLDEWVPWTVGGVVLLALAAVFAWTWRSNIAQKDEQTVSIRLQRKELIQRIAKLDDLHAVGEVSDDQWQQQRARLKSELLAIELELAD